MSWKHIAGVHAEGRREAPLALPALGSRCPLRAAWHDDAPTYACLELLAQRPGSLSKLPSFARAAPSSTRQSRTCSLQAPRNCQGLVAPPRHSTPLGQAPADQLTGPRARSSRMASAAGCRFEQDSLAKSGLPAEPRSDAAPAHCVHRRKINRPRPPTGDRDSSDRPAPRTRGHAAQAATGPVTRGVLPVGRPGLASCARFPWFAHGGLLIAAGRRGPAQVNHLRAGQISGLSLSGL